MKPQSIPRFPGSTVCPLHIVIQTEDLRLLYDSSDLGGRVGPGPSRALMHHFGKSWPLNSDEANWTKKNRWKWVKLWINLEQTWGMGMASGILWLSLAGWKGHHWVWFSDSKPPWKPGICYRLVVPRRFKKHVWSSFTFCIFCQLTTWLCFDEGFCQLNSHPGYYSVSSRCFCTVCNYD